MEEAILRSTVYPISMGIPKKKRFKQYPIGYFPIDLTEVRTAEGKRYLFVAVDRPSKFVFYPPCETRDPAPPSLTFSSCFRKQPHRFISNPLRLSP